MVFWQRKPFHLGAADDGEMVQVSWAINNCPRWDGKWMVVNPVKTGALHDDHRRQERSGLRKRLVGEVWLGSGQSNMQWTVSNSNNAERKRRRLSHPAVLGPADRGGQAADGCQQISVHAPERSQFLGVLYFFGICIRI